MKSVIISGAGGQLGQAFIEKLSFTEGYSVYSFDRGQLDIADQNKIERILSTLPQVRYWINCAAYTKVDDAEKNKKAADLYNTVAPGYIASACEKTGVHLIDFSSDYVYHNQLRRPLLETDPTEPKGVYARSKRNGELAIQESGVGFTILRTSWVYGPGGQNFVNTMLRLGKTKSNLRIVSDQLGAPTFTHDIVDAVKELIQLHKSGNQEAIKGIFNFANAGEVTWDNFARAIFNQAGISCNVESITTEEYGAPAPRPPYSVLNCDKISKLLKNPIPSWDDALQRFLKINP
ncbi:MAG TPA: dTDP-4-dehydrorhamnose reductase [Saprospiraceae bacterium]